MLEGKDFPFGRVALVADELQTVASNQTHLRRDLEKTPAHVLLELKDAIAKLGLRIVHYQTPAELAARASEHVDDVVLSIYGGQESRNRMALVPAICESFGLRYLGADAYARIISQDKETSKRLAKEIGLLTPEYVLIRETGDIVALKSFPLPLVIKPLWEGSSIGIGAGNLVRSVGEGEKLAKRLLDTLQQPVLIEEFVAGKEFNCSFIQLRDGVDVRLTEVFHPNVPAYFSSNLFHAEEKLDRNSPLRNRLIPFERLTVDDREGLTRLPKILGGLGYGRIDGKFFRNRFHFLEVTPDAWLGSSGAFASGFLHSGWSYEDIIGAVLLSTRE